MNIKSPREMVKMKGTMVTINFGLLHSIIESNIKSIIFIRLEFFCLNLVDLLWLTSVCLSVCIKTTCVSVSCPWAQKDTQSQTILRKNYDKLVFIRDLKLFAWTAFNPYNIPKEEEILISEWWSKCTHTRALARADTRTHRLEKKNNKCE